VAVNTHTHSLSETEVAQPVASKHRSSFVSGKTVH